MGRVERREKTGMNTFMLHCAIETEVVLRHSSFLAEINSGKIAATLVPVLLGDRRHNRTAAFPACPELKVCKLSKGHFFLLLFLSNLLRS